MKSVLISELNASAAINFLPYVWGLLKTAAEQEPRLNGKIRWLEPIYRREAVDLMVESHDFSAIDVVGLSCYTWNFELQCQLADNIKRINPDCIIVAGGPHPQVKDPEFFRKNPYIDIVVSKDGEDTFNSLLIEICHGTRDFRKIPGLYLPEGDTRDMVYTGTPRIPRDFSISPYLAQSEYYRNLIDNNKDSRFAAIWETNRGCPYSCSYCDWGSNTMSKIRQFPIERVQSEIEWLTSSDISMLLMADANFGILPRDIDIADHFTKMTDRYNFQKNFHFSPAKNNPTRSVAIAKNLMAHNVRFQPSLAIQHTNAHVLESVDRKNISAEKQYDVARELMNLGASVDLQLIMGIPGDNFDLWTECLAQLMEWGLHDDYSVFYFNLLPNAPAADAAYRDLWGLETIRRVVRDPSGNLDCYVGDGIFQEIIVGSKNFSTDEWIAMNVHTAIFRALHCGGLTRLIAIALRASFGVSFREFYKLVVDEFVAKIYRNGQIHAFVQSIYIDLIANETTIADQVTVSDLGDANGTLSVTHAVLTRLAKDADHLYEALGQLLHERFGSIDPALMSSLLDYQRNMLVLPDYIPVQGKRFALHHDWPAYFSGLTLTDLTEAVSPPVPIRDKEVRTTESLWRTTVFPRDAGWVGRDGPEVWFKWAVFAMENGQKVRSVLHQDIEVVATERPHVSPVRDLRSRLGRFRQWLAA